MIKDIFKLILGIYIGIIIISLSVLRFTHPSYTETEIFLKVFSFNQYEIKANK